MEVLFQFYHTSYGKVEAEKAPRRPAQRVWTRTGRPPKGVGRPSRIGAPEFPSPQPGRAIPRLPVHAGNEGGGERIPLADNDIAGTTIAQGTSAVLVLAWGNRDLMHFHEPDRFDPTRPDNQHLGFGSDIHLRYGARLARIEAQAALGAPLPHLGTAGPVEDPPPTGRTPCSANPATCPSNCDARQPRAPSSRYSGKRAPGSISAMLPEAWP
ncbi:cytochrome P450 [Streptomyces sp. NPDC001070]